MSCFKCRVGATSSGLLCLVFAISQNELIFVDVEPDHIVIQVLECLNMLCWFVCLGFVFCEYTIQVLSERIQMHLRALYPLDTELVCEPCAVGLFSHILCLFHSRILHKSEVHKRALWCGLLTQNMTPLSLSPTYCFHQHISVTYIMPLVLTHFLS